MKPLLFNYISAFDITQSSIDETEWVMKLFGGWNVFYWLDIVSLFSSLLVCVLCT